MAVYEINPLSRILTVLSPDQHVVKSRMVACKDRDLSKEARMMGTAKRALEGLSLTYQAGSKNLKFEARAYASPFHPQLYCVALQSIRLIPIKEFREAVSKFSFQGLERAVTNFFLEAFCHVNCRCVSKNVNQWLHILINDFQCFYDDNPDLFASLGIDVSTLNKLLILFYDGVAALRLAPSFLFPVGERAEGALDIHEEMEKSLLNALEQLDGFLLKLDQMHETLKSSLKSKGEAGSDRDQITSNIELIDEAKPHLLRIVVGFYASYACRYMSLRVSSTLTDRGYVESYSAESVFRQAIEFTRFENDSLFTSLNTEMMADTALENLVDSVIFFSNEMRALHLRSCSKPHVDELIASVARLRLPLSEESKVLYQQALVRFFTVERDKKWDFLSFYLNDAYFHLLNPKGALINASRCRLSWCDNSERYVEGSKLGESLLKITHDSLAANKKILKPFRAILSGYFEFFIHRMVGIAEGIRCPFNEEFLATKRDEEVGILACNHFATASLDRFSDMCERLNEDLNSYRQQIFLPLKGRGAKERLRIEGILDEICQSVLKESMSLLNNPNFLIKLFHYIIEKGLVFEQEGTVIIDINPENVDSIIHPLILLGVCPASFLDLFEWRLDQGPLSVSEIELASLISPEDALEFLPEKRDLAFCSGFRKTSLEGLPAPGSALEMVGGAGSSVFIEEASKKHPTSSLVPFSKPGPVLPAKESLLEASIHTASASSVLDGSSKVGIAGKKSSKSKCFIDRSVPASLSHVEEVGRSGAGSALASWSASKPKIMAEPTLEKDLLMRVEELNRLMIRGAKTKEIFTWIKHHGFEYMHHKGSHAIYRYQNQHLSIPDRAHLKPGLLCALKQSIIEAFRHKPSSSVFKKAS